MGIQRLRRKNKERNLQNKKIYNSHEDIFSNKIFILVESVQSFKGMYKL